MSLEFDQHFACAAFTGVAEGFGRIEEGVGCFDEGSGVEFVLGQCLECQADVAATGADDLDFVDYDAGQGHPGGFTAGSFGHDGSFGPDEVQGLEDAVGASCGLDDHVEGAEDFG